MRARAWVALAVFGLLAAPAPMVRAAASDPHASKAPAFVDGEVIVRMRPGVSAAGAVGEVHGRALGATRGWQLVQLSAGASVDEALRNLRGNPNVDTASANHVYYSMAVANDSLLSQEWGLTSTAATSAWSKTSGSSAVIVGIVDTGVATDHPDLKDNVVPGVSYVGGSDYDGNGHGSHVAGIIAAVNNDGFGVSGVAPHVHIMPLRALDSGGSGTTWSIAQAFTYAAAHGAKVVNASLGGPDDDPVMEDAIHGAPTTLFVFAAGNQGSNNDVTPSYPCNSPEANVVCVAASDSGDARASFSNYGKITVDLAAPGVGIVSTYPPGGADAGSQMLSDSPSGPYGNDADSWAQTAIDLTGESNCGLSYSIRGRVGPGDTVTAERSVDGGSTWSQVGSAFGPSQTTYGEFVSKGSDGLSADGQSMLLRFHLVSDASGTDDGVYIDGATVRCNGVSVWSDGFESGFATNWTTGGTGSSWGTTDSAWTWVSMSGTSMATPFVSGAAALLFSYRPTSSVARVKEALINSVDHLSAFSGNTVSGGRLNVARALTYVADSSAPSSPAITGSAFSSSFQRGLGISVGWKASDSGSGVKSYDVRYRRARYNGKLGSWATWKSGTGSASATFNAASGYTYCFDVRARDRMGNVSGWSSSRCTAFPVNDSALSASGAWSRQSSSTHYLGTYSLGYNRYSTLKLYNVYAKRIALVVSTCSGCGKVEVFFGSSLYGTFSLSGAYATRKIISVRTLSSLTGPRTVTIKIVSSGAPVRIEGLGISAA